MNLDDAIANRKTADQQLITAMRAAQAEGITANEIARRTQGLPGYSRAIVLELLGSEEIRERAIAALEDGGWKIGAGQDVHVYMDRRRVMIELLDDYDKPANSVTRLNWASGVGSALAKHSLTLWSDDHPIDSWEALATEPVEIVRRAS